MGGFGLCARIGTARLPRYGVRGARENRRPCLDFAEGFAGMDAEAGGDLIDDDQEEIRRLAVEFRFEQTRILRAGFAHYRAGRDQRRHMRSSSAGWRVRGARY